MSLCDFVVWASIRYICICFPTPWNTLGLDSNHASNKLHWIIDASLHCQVISSHGPLSLVQLEQACLFFTSILYPTPLLYPTHH